VLDRSTPVRVGGRSARFLKRVRPNRSFLEVDEFHALLDAAGELEAEARKDYKGLGRRAMVATLGLAGFRISEQMDLRVAQVDLIRSRFKLADAKTEPACERSRSRSTSATSCSSTPWTAGRAGCRSGRLITPSARRPASAGTRIASATASSPARPSGRTQTAGRVAWRRCQRSRRTRCGAPGRRSRR
jgi:integrase